MNKHIVTMHLEEDGSGILLKFKCTTPVPLCRCQYGGPMNRHPKDWHVEIRIAGFRLFVDLEQVDISYPQSDWKLKEH